MYNFEDWLFWEKDILYEPFMYWCTDEDYEIRLVEYEQYKRETEQQCLVDKIIKKD